MPIRWRLTLWFSVILFGILMVSGLVLYTLLGRYLNDEVDNNLKIYSAAVHGTLLVEHVHELDFNMIHSKLPAVNEFVTPGIYIQIIDREGRVMVKSDNLGTQELPIDPGLLAATVAIGTVSAGEGASVRMMVSPMYIGDKAFILQVAQSLAPVERTLSQVKLAVFGGSLLALVLAIGLGAAIVGRALAPVRRITGIARGIEESSDLGRRVHYHGPVDEIGRLATTFDHMIEHLNRVFKSQKEFVADASHELRSPLTVIQGNLDLLKRNLGEEDRRESLRAIEAESRRMTAIVNDLLLLAELEAGSSGSREPVSLKGLVVDEFARARTIAGKHKITLGRTEEISVRGEAHRLRQLVANLVDNAIKYTPEGGSIALSAFTSGEWGCIKVTDTGIGIGPEHIPHLFDRFYRVDKARSRAGGGTGLGLAIAQAIAEQHDGWITVDSEVGRGSLFTVWFKL